MDDGYKLTAPVGSYPAGGSWAGALDMSGNVYEWVKDWYDENYYASSPGRNPQGPDSDDTKVMRGGSWGTDEFYLRGANRSSRAAAVHEISIAFGPQCCP